MSHSPPSYSSYVSTSSASYAYAGAAHELVHDRDERLEMLMEKSSEISATSGDFYKEAKKSSGGGFFSKLFGSFGGSKSKESHEAPKAKAASKAYKADEMK